MPNGPQLATPVEIGDGDILWRRVALDSKWAKRKNGQLVVSSLAFLPDDGELSLHLPSLTSVAAIRARWPDCSVVKLSATLIRSREYLVQAAPTDDDPSHVSAICPQSRGINDVRRDAKAFASGADWEFLDPRLAALL